MKRLFVSVLLSLVFFADVSFSQLHPPAPIGWKRVKFDFKDTAFSSVSISFPQEFKVRKLDTGIRLESPYWIKDNPSGLRKNDVKYFFAVSVSVLPVSVLELAEKESQICFQKNFPERTLDSFREEGLDCFQPTHPGFTLSSGNHGLNQNVGFIELTDRKTLIVRWYTFDPPSKPAKHEALPEKDQYDLAIKIISTLEYSVLAGSSTGNR